MRKHEKFIQIDIKVQVKDTTSKKEQNIQTNNKDTTTGRIEEYIMRDMTARRSGAQRHLKKKKHLFYALSLRPLLFAFLLSRCSACILRLFLPFPL